MDIRLRAAPILLLALAACDARDGTGRSGPEWLGAPAEPVNLTTTLEPARVVAKTISAARGGTIAVTGSDGTRYRLTFPDSALLSDAVITMTPARSVEGLPLGGGSIAAVHLEPSGLRLLRPATLTIQSRVDVPVAEQVAYAYSGQGEDAYRYPMSRDPARIEMQVFHFSGYGFGRAAPDDPGRLALQRASGEMSRLQGRLAEHLDRARAAGEGDTDAARAATAAMVATAIDWHDAVLVPLIERAETDDRMATCCVQAILDWERSIQLTGMGSEDAARDAADRSADPQRRRLAELRRNATASLQRILDNAYAKGMDRAVAGCREQHDLNALMPILALERQAQLLGFPHDASHAKEAQRALAACMRFEVEFRSLFETRSAEAHLLHEVEAKVPVDASWEKEGTFASAPIRYVRYAERIDEGAPMNVFRAQITGTGTRPGTMVVHAIEWDRNPRAEPGVTCQGKDAELGEQEMAKALRDTAHLFVTFRPGRPTELQRATIARAGYVAAHQSHTWASEFEMAHGDQQVGEWSDDAAEVDEPIYRMELRQTAPGVWRAAFDAPDRGNTPGITKSEAGHLIVRHTPRAP